MSGMLDIWWVWLAAALVMGVAEVLLPVYLFLGFAIAAALMAGIVALIPGMGTAVLLAVFSALALVCWIGLRRVFKGQSSGARIVTKDINDH